MRDESASQPPDAEATAGHTPGPWYTLFQEPGQHIVGAGDHWVARLFHPRAEMFGRAFPGLTSLAPSPEEAAANAALIVQAPDLQAEVERLQRSSAHYSGDTCDVEALQEEAADLRTRLEAATQALDAGNELMKVADAALEAAEGREQALRAATAELLKVNPTPVVVRDNRESGEPIELAATYTERDLKRIADANAALGTEATSGLTKCPRCGRTYVETDLATGRQYCLYAADCGWTKESKE